MTTNVEMPHDDGLENSFRVSSIVANVTAILLDRQSRKVQGRRHRMRRSRRTRHFQVHKRRSIEDIYNELGPMYFRRAYQMHYSTFKALADELHPYIIHACGKKGGPRRFIPHALVKKSAIFSAVAALRPATAAWLQSICDTKSEWQVDGGAIGL